VTVYSDIFQRPEGRTLRGHDMAVVERRVPVCRATLQVGGGTGGPVLDVEPPQQP
jgi:hypothetical protein